jgi:hypothetical protein
MAPKRSMLEQMRDNPRGKWTIRDVDRLCAENTLRCDPPSRDSHFKVSAEPLAFILTIPAQRPIKPAYIRQLVDMVDLALAARGKERSDD